MIYFHENHAVLVDGGPTWLLSHRLDDLGIALTVSGPETVHLHEHSVTEADGSPLDLSKGKKAEWI
jgi:hypothetical protein